MLKKRLGKKGFTLVEIIVVLVILAILAAILIPSMVGWIERANEKSAVVAGRSALLALQTIASENYPATTIGVTATNDEATALAGIDGLEITAATIGANSQVATFTATYGDYTISYEDGEFTVE